VALFDYDPPTMSPNPENCDEELPFREGQLIKVHAFLLAVVCLSPFLIGHLQQAFILAKL
jgi:hypothetical protein